MVSNSKRANDLGNVMRQLKSGMTRGTNPRNLTPAEISALEQTRDRLKAQTRDANKERAINRIIAHNTSESDRVITEVSTAIVAATADSSTFFQAVNGAGSSTELRAQAAVLRVRAAEMARFGKLRAKAASGAAFTDEEWEVWRA